MIQKYLVLTFWILIAVFLLVASEFFIPVVRDLFRGSFLFLTPSIIFSLLGAALTILTLKAEIGGWSRKFLLLTGISSAGFFVSILLHNAFYALGILTGHITVLKYLTETLHIFFFITATIICPLGFLIGATASIVILIKNRGKF